MSHPSMSSYDDEEFVFRPLKRARVVVEETLFSWNPGYI